MKRKLKSDIFYVYVTPRGKNGNCPNVRLYSKTAKVDIASLKLADIPKIIRKNSKNLKKMTPEEKRKFKHYYGWA